MESETNQFDSTHTESPLFIYYYFLSHSLSLKSFSDMGFVGLSSVVKFIAAGSSLEFSATYSIKIIEIISFLFFLDYFYAYIYANG